MDKRCKNCETYKVGGVIKVNNLLDLKCIKCGRPLVIGERLSYKSIGWPRNKKGDI